MVTCADAIEEAVMHYGGIVSNRQIFNHVKRIYIGVWKDGTIRAHIIGCSVNHSSSHHHKHCRKFLFTVGPGQVRLYDPETDGKWKWTPTGMVKIESDDARPRGDPISEPSKDGDYCQKCGAPVDPTDEKCPNGHVLAEVGRAYVRRASASIKITADALLARRTQSLDFFSQREWSEIYGNIIERLKKLPRFIANIVTEDEFIDFIKKFDSHLSSYESIWMSGYFDNSYAKIVEKYYHPGHKCDVKILSLGFRKDGRGQQNAKALEKMENQGVEVRVNDNLHARMYIAYNGKMDTMTIFLGSFDYTKECMSGARSDIGICTSNPDLILGARNFFTNIFASTDSKTLVDYKKGISMA